MQTEKSNEILIQILLFHFQRFIRNSDSDKSGDVGLGEFIKYLREHERNLRLQFSHLDKNKDGNESELITYCIAVNSCEPFSLSRQS